MASPSHRSGAKETFMADLNKVQEAVVSAGSSGIRNLAARQNGTTIEIHGVASSIAEKQRVFHVITERVGDAAGVVNLIEVATATAAAPQQAAQAAVQPSQPQASGAATSQRTHTVAHGETLGGIAQHYYGKASEARKIFEANRDKLADPDKVHEGTTLVIP
jgi:LysM repeat protein